MRLKKILIYLKKKTQNQYELYCKLLNERECPKVCANLKTDVRQHYSVWRFFIMARRKSDSPQKAAMREMMQGYLKENDISIKSGNDVNFIMRDMM